MSAVTTPSVEQTVTDVIRDLAEQGTSKAVADQLRDAGVKGCRGDSCSCPLATYLLQLPGVDQIEILDDHLLVWGEDTIGPITILLPAPVAGFVTRFDAGIYLDLVELTPAVVA